MPPRIHKIEVSARDASGRTIAYLGEALCRTRLRPLRKAARMLLAAGVADEDDMIVGPGIRKPKRIADVAKLTVEQLDGPV